MSNNIHNHTNPTMMFNQRLVRFTKEELMLSNNEAAELSGVSYPRFMAWLSSEILPLKVQDLHAFVCRSLEKKGRKDLIAEQITAWLCFGDQIVPNPFEKNVFGGLSGKLIEGVFLHMKYIEDLMVEAGVNRNITKKKLELAVKTLAMSKDVHFIEGKIVVPEDEKDLLVGILRL